jgi:hypothetical protein
MFCHYGQEAGLYTQSKDGLSQIRDVNDIGLSFIAKPRVLEKGLSRPLVAIYGISCLIVTSLGNQVIVTIPNTFFLGLLFSIDVVFTQGCLQIF